MNHKLKSKIAKTYNKNQNSSILTESAVHLVIQHELPRNSARPKGSALFYEKLNPDVSLLVSGAIPENCVRCKGVGMWHT